MNIAKMDARIEVMADEAQRTDQGVWVSDIPRDASSIIGFTCDHLENDEKGFIALTLASDTGETISADIYPSEMWIKPSSKEKKLKHIFSAAGLHVVSATFAEILRRHDMGRNALYPVTLLKKNRRDAYEGEYFFLNLCEKKSGFDPQQSPNYNSNFRHRKGGMPGILSQWDIAVSEAVLEGPDLWMDPTLFKSLFVKGALAEELLAKKMFHSNGTEGLSIARCQVIDMAGNVIEGAS